MPVAERDALRRELARRIGLAPDKIDRDTASLTQGTFLGGIAPSMPYYLDYRFLAPYHHPPLDAGVASIRDDLGYNSDRSEERRVGKEWVSQCRYRWAQYN